MKQIEDNRAGSGQEFTDFAVRHIFSFSRVLARIQSRLTIYSTGALIALISCARLDL
jgi:hypothetical protein